MSPDMRNISLQQGCERYIRDQRCSHTVLRHAEDPSYVFRERKSKVERILTLKCVVNIASIADDGHIEF